MAKQGQIKRVAAIAAIACAITSFSPVEPQIEAIQKKTMASYAYTREASPIQKPQTIKVNDKTAPLSEWEKMLEPSLNPKVKFGSLSLEFSISKTEKHMAQLDIIEGPVSELQIIYPKIDFQKDRKNNCLKALVHKENCSYSRLFGSGGFNYLFNPSKFSPKSSFSCIVSGTYATFKKGLLYPRGGINFRGKELFKPFEEPDEYSRSIMSTFYIGKNGRVGIKPYASKQERLAWPTFIDVGKMMVAGGETCYSPQDFSRPKKDPPRLIIGIKGESVVFAYCNSSSREIFSLALETLGIEQAAQLDGGSAAQYCIATQEEKRWGHTAGRATVNLFAFPTPEISSVGRLQ